MKKLWVFPFVMMVLAGCAGQVNSNYLIDKNYEGNYLIDKNYEAVDKLVSSAGQALDKETPVIVATLVSIDDLEESSRLGRAVSEQVSARLAQKGYKPIELKLRKSLFIKKEEGELLLSREVKEIADSHETDTVIVGTYSPSAEYVFINLKVIDTDDNTVITGQDYGLRRWGCYDDQRRLGIKNPSDYPCNVVRSLLESYSYSYPRRDDWEN